MNEDNEQTRDIQSQEDVVKNSFHSNISDPSKEQENLDIKFVADSFHKVKSELQKVIVGQEKAIKLLLVALFSGGHVLIEGVPGIAKTLKAKLLAKVLNTKYSRIQFTPDLMPSDVLGTNVFNAKEIEFEFIPGPIFANIILIDEINRAPAKTQSSLFEVMEERQVTTDGVKRDLPQPFFVIGTQNPIEQDGTYHLPEAQLDRFLFRINMTYPSLEEELRILKKFQKDFNQKIISDIKPALDSIEIKRIRNLVESVHISEELLGYIAEIVTATRKDQWLSLGASPRGSLSLLRAAKAIAAISGRSYVIPDDIKNIVSPVLNHRVIMTPEREIEGHSTNEVIERILLNIKAPI